MRRKQFFQLTDIHTLKVYLVNVNYIRSMERITMWIDEPGGKLSSKYIYSVSVEGIKEDIMVDDDNKLIGQISSHYA